MLLELNDREHELLREVLSRELADLGPEIHHTDDREFREELRSRRTQVRTLLERMGTPQHAR